MIDTHCHLYGSEFEEDRNQVIQRARQERVLMMVQVGTSVEESRQAVALANHYDDMVASVGIHPHEWKKYAEGADMEGEIQELKKIALANAKVVAVGECGLDFGRMTDDRLPMTMNDIDRMKQFQKELFEAQINLAEELKLPLIIHCRDAHQEVAHILRATSNKLPAVVIHCFTGNWEDAKRYLDLGCYISFSGIVTFGKKTENLLEAVKSIPLDRMLLETDAPFLAPTPLRGKRNEPAFIRHTFDFVARLRGLDFAELEKQTDRNVQKIFRVK